MIEIAEMVLPGPAFFLVHDDVTSTERLNGGPPMRKAWRAGDVVYLPGMTKLQVWADRPYSETIIGLDLVQPWDAMSRTPSGEHYASIQEAEIRMLVTAMREALVSGRYGYRESVPLAMQAALGELMSARQGTAPGAGRINRSVFEFIESNLGRRICMTELAGVANMSRFHFSRVFKAAVGLTPARYLLERRVAMAAALLVAGHMSIAEVGYRSGFSSQQHFTTAFRSVMGSTPGRHRGFSLQTR
ncbi:helix-turn-helix transcriptional regulator [Kaistia sp. 32K]|uniref:helix-turn-helix transcriptional regulator n=1 Tax=Kaistia sp. 32K TaxID=2795690 RepID=UPI0019168E29|nr:AraC family transcriptional regulator [Kaistia sp. 32K]